MQGALAVMHGLQRMLAEISGMDDASLAPLAGAQGELAGVLVIKAYLESIGERRTTILVPDSAHGTNPATASMAGFNVVAVKPQPDGDMDLDELRKALEEHGPDRRRADDHAAQHARPLRPQHRRRSPRWCTRTAP